MQRDPLGIDGVLDVTEIGEILKGAEIALYFDTTDSTSHTSFATLTNCWLSILTPWWVSIESCPNLPSSIDCVAFTASLASIIFCASNSA